MTAVVGLDLGGLPDLPQCAFLRELAADLLAAPEVTAVWLGGSLACGKGDADSDVDLRVAVASEAFDPAALPPGTQRAAERAVVHLAFPWGEGIVLHHLMLDDGAIYDLLVQSAVVEPRAETRLVLGCRDAALAAKLAEPSVDPPPTAFPSPTGREVREILLSFWINQRKHIKVLRRGLAIVAWEGEHRMRQDLVRLWFIRATGSDCGPVSRLTIHTISPVVRAVQEFGGAEALALLGAPLGSEAEIVQGATALQNAASAVGRELAATLGFEYPASAEETVRRCWAVAFGEQA